MLRQITFEIGPYLYEVSELTCETCFHKEWYRWIIFNLCLKIDSIESKFKTKLVSYGKLALVELIATILCWNQVLIFRGVFNRVYHFHSGKRNLDLSRTTKCSLRQVKYSNYYSYRISDNCKPKSTSVSLLFRK